MKAQMLDIINRHNIKYKETKTGYIFEIDCDTAKTVNEVLYSLLVELLDSVKETKNIDITPNIIKNRVAMIIRWDYK